MKNFLNFVVFTCIIIFLLIGSSVYSIGQIPDYLTPNHEAKHICFDHTSCSRYHQHDRFQSENNLPTRNYDVLNYDIFLDWQFSLLYGSKDSIFFSAIQRIKLRITEDDTRQIELDAVDLIIDSIKVDGEIHIAEEFTTAEFLDIEFATSKEFDEIVELEIHYRIDRKYTHGFFFYKKGPVQIGQREFLVEENLAYTFGQPEVSRFWMPCNDRPSDKAFASVAIKVPEGYTALSNGYLDSLYISPEFDNIHGGHSIYYYIHKEPISTYLMVAVASVYKHFSDEYTRISNPEESVPLDYYVWQSDYDGDFSKGDQYDAKRSLSLNPDMLKFFSEMFGEFPYDSYGIVALEPVWYGGMEHPNMVTINRSWLRGNGEIGLAHEAAHQWIGNMITCATWQDIWINEGGASWCEALWYEHRNQDTNAYRFLISQHSRHYLNNVRAHNVAAYGISTDSIFIYGVVSYSKSGFIYNMLHYYFGRENFLSFMQFLFDKYYFSAISTEDFKISLVEFFPDDELFITDFFEHWLYSPGHPIFKIDYDITTIAENDYQINLTIDQTQNPEKFRDYYISRVPLLFYKDGLVQKRYEYIHRSRQMFAGVNTDFIPDSVSIDWTELLFSLDEGITSVHSRDLSGEQITITPNPILSGNMFSLAFDAKQSAQTNINLVDVLGRHVMEIKSGFTEIGNHYYNIPTSGLSPGSYTIIISLDGAVVAKRLVVL